MILPRVEIRRVPFLSSAFCDVTAERIATLSTYLYYF